MLERAEYTSAKETVEEEWQVVSSVEQQLTALGKQQQKTHISQLNYIL
jgi:hypothetical protein